MPNLLFLILFTVCPSNLSDPDSDRCEDVTISVGLFLDDEPPLLVRESFEDALVEAINDGRLQENLDIINPISPVTILTGLEDPVIPQVVRPRQGLSGGATAGLSVAAVLMVGFVVGMFVLRRDNEMDDKSDLVPVGEEEIEPDPRLILPSSQNSIVKPGDETSALSSDAVLGAKKPDYGSPNVGDVSLDASNDSAASPKITTASSAGSSGWSSMYESSVNTSESYDQASGSRLVDISADSGVLQQNMSSDAASLADLDAAIQTGDWAA